MMRVLLLLVLFAANASAQRGATARPRTCVLEWNNLPPGSHSRASITTTNKYTTWWGGGFRANCRGTRMTLTSDSAEYSEDARVMTLIGNARYTEDSVTITASTMRYFELTAQVFAEGNVRVRMKTASTLEADLLQYLRPLPPTRAYSAADASGRTRLVLRDSAAVPDSQATVITAQRLHMLRDSLFYAGGDVVMTTSDIVGTSDSAETNSNRRFARLLGTRPQLKGQGTRNFTIDGNVLDIFGRERELERLLAKGKAVAVSDSMTLSADTLDIRTTGTTIDRVEAWGPGRARAISPEQDITANRLVLAMPGQKLQDLRAYGRARAETKPDSTVVSTERDWIEGDTLTATFETVTSQPRDAQPPIRTLFAAGNARSYRQQAAEDKNCKEPALNYVTGKRIQVEFRTGAVQEVRVTGEVRGINLAPCKATTDSVPPRGRGNSR